VLLLVTASLVLAGLIAALLLRLRSCRVVSSTRSVLLHIPIESAWNVVSDFPALFAAHGHGRRFLRVTSSALEHGDGRTAGSVWLQSGTWGRRPYSARIEILAVEAPCLLAIRLIEDTLGSERGLLRHRGELRLRAVSERSTKVTWRLSARLDGLPNMLGRLFVPERVDARLLDLGLRSLKAAIDGGARPTFAAPVPEPFRSPQPR
jgi:hypothetical protein